MIIFLISIHTIDYSGRRAAGRAFHSNGAANVKARYLMFGGVDVVNKGLILCMFSVRCDCSHGKIRVVIYSSLLW